MASKKKLFDFSSYAQLEHDDLIVPGLVVRGEWHRWISSWSAPFHYRNGPVPGVHKYSNGSCYRGRKHRQTIVELAYSKRFEEAEAVCAKPVLLRKGAVQRNGITYDPWNDDPVRCLEKTWKRTRSNQFKASGCINRNVHSPAYWDAGNQVLDPSVAQ